MAYCVHCGVKLGEAEKKCPLCGTEVMDPAAKAPESEPEKPYPVRGKEQTLTMSRKYAVSLLSLLLLAPAAICLLVDLLGGMISWSIYPVGVLALIWIVFTVPLLRRKHRLYSTVLITGAAFAGYLWLVEQVSNTPGWFFPIVLPALALFVAMVCFAIALVRKWKWKALPVTAAVLVEIGIVCLAVEMLCISYGIGGETPTWSPYVIVPCFFIALLLYVILKNRPLYEELKRRLHF